MATNNTNLKFSACYIRVSTEDQVEFSPDSQLREMQAYAASNGIAILEDHIYIDEGISGRKADRRPAFQSMIAAAKVKPKPFDMVLLYKFSRFARNREDSVVYKSVLRKKCGIGVISITEPLDPDNKMSIIMEAFIEAMDEYYSINLAEDVRRTMTEKAIRGELQSSPSFGYTVKGNTLTPIPAEAALVREVFLRFISGEGYFSIARWLNSLGTKTHRNNRFEHRTIEYMIRNPVYIGKLRWNPAGKTKRGDFDNTDIILADAKHEAIIDVNTWQAAQHRVVELKTQWKYHQRPMTEHKDWLSGLVRCAVCGSTLVFTKPHYWKCNAYAKGACRHSQHIRDEIIKAALLEQIERDASTTYGIDYAVIRHNCAGIDELAALKLQQSKLQNKMTRLREAFLNGADSVGEYKIAKQAIRAEVTNIESRIAELQSTELKKDAGIRVKNAICESLSVLLSEATTDKEKYITAHNMIEKCVWDKKNNLLQVYYRYVYHCDKPLLPQDFNTNIIA